ncbi:flagellar hook-associated protein FlgK [Sporosarcina sp. CAU 1771]
MRSSFMGLETSKRGLFTQQSALYTTGHNISNANTLGYSRQRVNMEATAGHPGVGLNAGTMPGFLGTGVQAGSIQRIRDSFVDHQFRQESTKLGYWDTTSKAITQMEDVLNEPSDYGLQKSLSEFWQSLQVLSANPENSGAREVTVQRGVAVADSFNYIDTSLRDIQTNTGQEIGITTKDVNAILRQISELNDQITKVEPNGYLPNDLYDARDMLLDQLSAIVPIETDYVPSGGRAIKGIAEGSVTVSIKTAGASIEVVKGYDFAEMSVNNGTSDAVTEFTFTGSGAVAGDTLNVNQMVNTGSMKSLVDSYGYVDAGGTVKGLFPEMLEKLNEMANKFAEEFNKVHMGDPNDPTTGPTDLNGDKGKAFFVNKDVATDPITAANIYVNKDIIADPGQVAASDSNPAASTDPKNPQEGNGKNALNLSNVQFSKVFPGGATVQSYFQSVIGKLGVDGQQADRLAHNTATLLGAVEHRRASISSVSLDEEMTDMIRFQQSYNASARMITVVDETLDKIINGMGVVGR